MIRARITFCILLLCFVFGFSGTNAAVISPSTFVIRLHGLAYPYVSTSDFDRPTGTKHAGLGTARYAGLVSAHVLGGYGGHRVFVDLWGKSSGKFHIKNEIDDHLLYNDETSHLFVSYKLSQGFTWAYKTYGLSGAKARMWGHIEAAALMTLVEYPVDAYNPSQGMGITDLIADYTGVGLSYLKSVNDRFRDFDLKFSVKSVSRQRPEVLGYDVADYDNYIYWMTYRKSVMVLGIGYSTTRSEPTEPDPQFLLGIGTTLPDLVKPISGGLARLLRPFEVYYLNFHLEIL